MSRLIVTKPLDAMMRVSSSAGMARVKRHVCRNNRGRESSADDEEEGSDVKVASSHSNGYLGSNHASCLPAVPVLHNVRSPVNSYLTLLFAITPYAS